MNQGQLNAIKERVAKAKSGPWDINRNSDDDVFVTDIWFDGEDGGHVEIHGDTVASSIYNAEFIAHAREDVPALVVEVERLREVLKGAVVVSNQAKGLVEENKRLRQALTEILDFKTFDLAKFESQVIEIAVQALRGGEKG